MSDTEKETTQGSSALKRYLSPLNVWALSFGCAVGWGAFVMPGTTFLPIAGPLGTAIGMAIGAAVMLVIGANYHYMMNLYPDAGGTYTYAKRVFGYDHGFLSAWFLLLVYIAITWANATALPLIFRNLFGDMFQFGFHYQIAGFHVYGGEVLLSLSALLIFGFVCIRGGRFAARIQTVMALILFGGVLFAFSIAAVRTNGAVFHLTPHFAPEKSPLSATFNIVALAPWAFAGFESISNSTQEFQFSPKKSLSVMLAAVVISGMAYIFLALLAISVLPDGYTSWTDYINDIGLLPGLTGLPTFHAIDAFLGRTGLITLGLSVVAAVITGLLGNYIAASRLIYSIAADNFLPAWFCELSDRRVPRNAILFVMLLSLPIPFFGRTAIGWIVDVNTIGATIAYAYTSAVAFRCAKKQKNLPVTITGIAGLIFSLIFFLYFMVPNFWVVSALSTESYLILVAWSILGFVFFRWIFQRDQRRRLGKSTVVWIVLLFLIFFTSMLWVRQATHDTTRTVLAELSGYNEKELAAHGVSLKEREKEDSQYYLEERMEVVNRALTKNSVVQMTLISMALFIMFNIYNNMMRREREMEIQKAAAEQSSKAKSVFLSNMSHDIRTPMNAIIGYTALAKKVDNLPPEETDLLNKIEASSEHLLALINDVLEMSRIESGKMELAPVRTNLIRTVREIYDLFAAQMESKRIHYTVSAESVKNPWVLCDGNRLNRVLLNLISNAFKFTPENGSVSVILSQTGAGLSRTGGEENTGSYEIRVKDTGTGMSPKFAAKVFEAYSRERTASKIQGTGLGMAITKSIVDLMGGEIRVETAKGKGTEFIIRVDFPLAEETEADSDATERETSHDVDFAGMRLLLVEDNEINREIATMLLEEAGFTLNSAENGKIAVEMVQNSIPGYYQAVLMDIQMPVMNGYDAAKAIRALSDADLANIPIIAMTANAFTEDIQAAKDAGMNAHVAKPIDVDVMMQTLAEVLR